jgi:hypothetical protein
MAEKIGPILGLMAFEHSGEFIGSARSLFATNLQGNVSKTEDL